MSSQLVNNVRRLSALQVQLLNEIRRLDHCLSMIDRGIIEGPFNPEDACLTRVRDAIRAVRLAGITDTPCGASLPQAMPTAISRALGKVDLRDIDAGAVLRDVPVLVPQHQVDGMDDMLRSTESRAFDHAAEAQAIAGIALDLKTGEVSA